MKPGLAAILKHGVKKYLVMDIWEGLKKQSDYEKKIIQARYSGLSFCELSELDQRIAIDQIMFRGAASSGCALPQTETFASFIAEEINKLSNEQIEKFKLNSDKSAYELSAETNRDILLKLVNNLTEN